MDDKTRAALDRFDKREMRVRLLRAGARAENFLDLVLIAMVNSPRTLVMFGVYTLIVFALGWWLG